MQSVFCAVEELIMLATSLLIIAAGIALGQQEPGKAARAEAKPKAGESVKAIDDFKEDAAEYVIRLASRPKDKLVLQEEPLLHWGNPARTGEDGAVFVWILDGRPEVIASVFTYRTPKAIRRKHEYHSLAAGPLTAEYRGEVVWAPATAGVTFQPVPEALQPAETARQRLSQMKILARDFSATLVDLEDKRADLRLVPQPLLRYEPKDRQILDGALFSFALGTDPEVILLLEARSTGKEPPVWQYAFARYHYVDLKAFHKGREVWSAAPLREIHGLEIGSPKYRDSVYTTYHVKTTPIAE